MRYKTRPGVVLTKICGSLLLIPTRAASEACPHILRLSFISAICWEMIGNGKPIDDIYRVYAILSKKPPEDVHSVVDGILGDLSARGYLITVEDETR